MLLIFVATAVTFLNPILVQGIRAEIWPNLKQIGIKLDLVLFEAQSYVEYHVKTPPEDFGEIFIWPVE